jgi:CO/xanthine dehydrogenase FAD-binding subunit
LPEYNVGNKRKRVVVKMFSFELERPTSLEEAINILSRLGTKALPKAGGTDLLINMKKSLVKPEVVVDLNLISELSEVRFDKNTGLWIGATATCTGVLKCEEVKKNFPALHDACLSHSDWQIRNRATVVGNICSAVPSGDVLPALYCYEAKVRTAGQNGEREIPISSFIQGPRKTDLKLGEMVKGVLIPMPQGKSSGCYVKHGRRNALDLAQVGVCCIVVENNGDVEYRLAYGAVAPTPLRALEAEKAIKGYGKPDELILERVASLAKKSVKPITDVRASSEYRLAMVGELTKRAIRVCLERLREEG